MSKAVPQGEAARAERVHRIWRWVLPSVLVVVLLALLVVGSAIGPYLFSGATLRGEIAQQVHQTTGLTLTAPIPGRFDLLPRPHIIIHRPHIGDSAGALTIQAEKLDGDVRLLPLIVGRVELSSVALVRPRLSIDLDAAPMRPDSLIGRAMQAKEPLRDGEQRLGSVVLSDGVASIKGKMLRRTLALDAVNVTLDWRELDSPATLTGTLSFQNTATDISAWIAQPARLMRGDHSAVNLYVRSAPIELSANGDLISASTTAFRGQLTASTPSMTSLLDLVGEDTTLIAPFANVSLASEAAVGVDSSLRTSIDLQKLKLRADGNDYEGALALQTGERPLLSGTLATEQLVLTPFLHRMPALIDANRHWSPTPVLGREPQPLDLDLRVSATHMRLAPFTVDDAALSIMTRGDRTEVALVEGKAYGGAVKGRFSVGLGADGINLRAAGSLLSADAASLSWDALGRQLALGSLSASLNLETNGDSPATLIAGLRGWAKASMINGELSGVDLSRALREVQRNRPQALLSGLRTGRTSFSTFAVDTRVADGVATIEDGALSGSDATLLLTGSADIAARSLDARADVTPPGKVGASATPPSLGFDIKGSFDKPLVRPIYGVR